MKYLLTSFAMILFFSTAYSATDDGSGEPESVDSCAYLLATGDGGGQSFSTNATDDGSGKPNEPSNTTDATDDGSGVEAYIAYLNCINETK